ncbi:ATP-binding cassette domain-containing protein [Clostridium sp. JN-9]|uniref:ABC transporter ATP-binding protein n=1 Tax=Clostridium sp. JN-9 TaxID=2507159 RepID=UPI000FFE29C3|nr:ATP-binding cassette domain-containing protein [Clostridium sp. JN-9]QAT41708.1 ATP-binding cassette domain-containing protein [Clostridium sp. JN-9]
MTLLKLNSIYYKDILKNINLDINNGDYFSIIGPSGSGKSTLLKLCSNLISSSSGDIIYKDKNITDYSPMEYRKQVAYCFQTPYLFGDKVINNLTFPFNIRNIVPDKKLISKYLEMFNLDEEILNKENKNLSGGEKQRISLIRTLLCKPEILLLDEVTSALDAENTQIVEEVVKKLNKDGITILWVTHNLEQSKKNANKLLTIEAGEIKSLEVIDNG